jgi:hypothetical protein
MKKILLTTLALSLLATPLANANTNTNFSDLDEDHPRFNQIQWLARSGVVEGYPDGTFRPENCVNRAEFLKILYTTTYADTEVAAQTSNPFPDVDENAWYGDYVLSAYADGVISGYGDGTFKPDQCVTKPEVLKMASEAYYSDEQIKVELMYNFTLPNGVTEDAWFYKYYSFAQPMNLAVYDPEFTKDYPISFQGATRADVAETLWRFEALQTNDATLYTDRLSPSELFQRYMGLEEGLTFYYPTDWRVEDEYYYETAAGEQSDMATIILQSQFIPDHQITINQRMVDCGEGEFQATCLETEAGYTISSYDPPEANLKVMKKIQSTLERNDFQESWVLFDEPGAPVSFNYPSSWSATYNEDQNSIHVSSPQIYTNSEAPISIILPFTSSEEYEETNKSQFQDGYIDILENTIDVGYPAKHYRMHGWDFHIIQKGEISVSAGAEGDLSPRQVRNLTQLLDSIQVVN